jgi:hypothetical protein
MPPTLRFRTPGNERVALDKTATKASISHVKECLVALSVLQGQLEACQTDGGVDVLLDDISPALGVMEPQVGGTCRDAECAIGNST